MVSAWPEPPFAKLAGACVGMEALALRGATIRGRFSCTAAPMIVPNPHHLALELT
jgi:hypothetical protein